MSTRATSASALGAALVLALFGAVACSGSEPDEGEDTQPAAVSPEVSACISGNPPGEPFDLGQIEDGSSTTLEGFSAECRSSGGRGCDEPFISLEAARCIARDSQFQAGLEQWALSLKYEVSYRRVTWGVQNVLVDDGPANYSGESLVIDAVSGRVLGRTSWRAAQ